MKTTVHRMEQGSPEWFAVRRSCPTASCFHKIITPKTMKPSAQAIGYASQLLAEWLTGETVAETLGGFVARGSEMEAEAVAWYELTRGVKVDRVGFVLAPEVGIGCSPDGLVGDDGDVEIKCLSAANHVRALLEPDDADYRLQVQGRLWITGRRWCDLVRYYPKDFMPSIVERYERDEEVIGPLSEAVLAFVDKLADYKLALIEKGCQPKGEVCF